MCSRARTVGCIRSLINRGNPMLIIPDLDGTLDINDHRAHFLQKPTPDWRGFFEACDMDGPNTPVIATVLALSMWAGHEVRIWTGRSDIVASKTVMWLKTHHLNDLPLKMRAEGDHTPD